MQLMAIGLLLVVLPTFINNFVKTPDFLRGLLMGIGIVLEIAAFVKLKKGPAAAHKSTQVDS